MRGRAVPPGTHACYGLFRAQFARCACGLQSATYTVTTNVHPVCVRDRPWSLTGVSSFSAGERRVVADFGPVRNSARPIVSTRITDTLKKRRTVELLLQDRRARPPRAACLKPSIVSDTRTWLNALTSFLSAGRGRRGGGGQSWLVLAVYVYQYRDGPERGAEYPIRRVACVLCWCEEPLVAWNIICRRT